MPIAHAVSALPGSAQLNPIGNHIGNEGAAELAKALATNHMLTGVRAVARCMRDGARRSTLDAMPIALLCSTQLTLVNDQIGDAGVAELAKALATNRTLTQVCLAWHGARWDEHALRVHAPFALTRGRLDVPTQLTLPRRYMSTAARDRLDKAWPAHSIVWR